MAILMNSDGTEVPSSAGGGALVVDSDTERFATDVIEASNDVPVLVDFWAEWCGPCKQLGPALEKLVREYAGAVKLVKINVDENQALAGQLRVQSIPMVYAFKGGQPVDAFTGALPESQLRQFIERLTGAGGSPIDQALEQAKNALEAGDAEGAGKIYSEIFRAEPNPTAAAGLARSLMAAGDSARAEEFVDGLPDDLKAHQEIAAVRAAIELEKAGNQASGETDALRAAVDAEPANHQARFDLAIALYGAGDAEAAIDELVEIVKRDREWNEQAARNQLIKIFDALGATHEVTVAGRRKLSSVLFS